MEISEAGQNSVPMSIGFRLFNYFFQGQNAACQKEIQDFIDMNEKIINERSIQYPEVKDDPVQIPYYSVVYINMNAPKETGTYLTINTFMEYVWIWGEQNRGRKPPNVLLFIFLFVYFIKKIGIYSSTEKGGPARFIDCNDYYIRSLKFFEDWTINDLFMTILLFNGHLYQRNRKRWQAYRGYTPTQSWTSDVLSQNILNDFLVFDSFMDDYRHHIDSLHETISGQGNNNQNNDNRNNDNQNNDNQNNDQDVDIDNLFTSYSHNNNENEQKAESTQSRRILSQSSQTSSSTTTSSSRQASSRRGNSSTDTNTQQRSSSQGRRIRRKNK